MSDMSNVVSIAEIKQRKMIAQYIAFYGYRKEVCKGGNGE
jgi:hypothetical protein